MKMIDANIILRYILEDNEELSFKARQIIEETTAEIFTFDKKLHKLLNS